MLGRICRGSDSRWLRGFIGLGTGSVTRQPQPGPRDPLPPCPESNMVSTETCNLTQWPAKALVLPVLAGAWSGVHSGQALLPAGACTKEGVVVPWGYLSLVSGKTGRKGKKRRS